MGGILCFQRENLNYEGMKFSARKNTVLLRYRIN